MKEVKHWICDICGTEYKDSKACARCEKGHVKIEAIESTQYLALNNDQKGYPMRVKIKMKDGAIITYTR